MSQETIYLPFPVDPSPDIAGIRQRTFDWFRSCGMFNSDAAVHKHLLADISDLGSRWHPTATNDNMDLATCAIIWAAMTDDQIDGTLDKRPHLVAQLVNDLNRVMYPDVAPRYFQDAVLVSTFAKLWEWSVQGMSASWCARLRTAWEGFNNAYIVETYNRYHGKMMTMEEYIPLRRHSGYMYVAVAYMEKTLGFEMPPELLAMPVLQEMIRMVCDTISIGNDIHSLEKEEGREDIHNIVMMLQHERHCTRQEAIAITCNMINDWIAHFLLLEKEIPVLCQSFQLSAEITSSVLAYTSGLGRLIGGYYVWARSSRRYHAGNFTTSRQPGFPESYL